MAVIIETLNNTIARIKSDIAILEQYCDGNYREFTYISDIELNRMADRLSDLGYKLKILKNCGD